MKYPDAGINPAKSGLTARAGLYFNAGLHDKGDGFNLQDLDPYLLFDAETSMLGNLENPTLDLDPATPDTLDVITATRAGIATFTAADGQIVTADPDTVRVDHVQGEELTPTKYQRVENTDFSSWNHARTSDTANAAISPDGGNNATYLEQNAGETNAGSIYRFDDAVTGVFTLSVYAKKKEKNFVVIYDTNTDRAYFNLDTGTVGTVQGGNTANIEDAGNGWFRCSVTFTASSGAVKAFYVGDTDNSLTVTGGGGIYIYGPQLEEGTTATDFVPNTTGSPKFIASATYGPRVPMMLIEPSATNLVPYSEDSGAWSKTDVTVTPNTTAAPDGNQTANTAVATGSSPQVTSTGNYATSGLEYTISVFAKAETDAIIQLDVSNAVFGAVNATFNARTGELTDGDETKVSIEYLNDGWKRFSFTATCLTTGTSSFLIRLQNTEPVHLWGYQFEQGSVATSYIPTSGGSVAERTRNADNLVIDGTAFSDFYNDSEGTIYCEFVYDFDPAYEYLYVIRESPTDEIRTQLTTGDDIRTRYTVANSHTGVVSPNGTVRGSLNRHAYSYKTDNFRASINGTAESEDLTGTVSLSPIWFQLGGRGSNAVTNLRLKKLLYWPTHSSNL